jgi:hypothetical protein
MFVRERHVKGRNGKAYTYRSIVETFRGEDCKPRQRTVYDMGTRHTIDECIEDAQKWLDHWLKEDQAQHNMYAAMVGIQLDPNHVAKARARWQEEIDLLTRIAARVTRG